MRRTALASHKILTKLSSVVNFHKLLPFHPAESITITAIPPFTNDGLDHEHTPQEDDLLDHKTSKTSPLPYSKLLFTRKEFEEMFQPVEPGPGNIVVYRAMSFNEITNPTKQERKVASGTTFKDGNVDRDIGIEGIDGARGIPMMNFYSSGATFTLSIAESDIRDILNYNLLTIFAGGTKGSIEEDDRRQATTRILSPQEKERMIQEFYEKTHQHTFFRMNETLFKPSEEEYAKSVITLRTNYITRNTLQEIYQHAERNGREPNFYMVVGGLTSRHGTLMEPKPEHLKEALKRLEERAFTTPFNLMECTTLRKVANKDNDQPIKSRSMA